LKAVIEWLRDEVQILAHRVNKLEQALSVPAPSISNHNKPNGKRRTKLKGRQHPVSDEEAIEMATELSATFKRHPNLSAWRCAGMVARKFKRSVPSVRDWCIDLYDSENTKRKAKK
jgi:hypothetical protein